MYRLHNYTKNWRKVPPEKIPAMLCDYVYLFEHVFKVHILKFRDFAIGDFETLIRSHPLDGKCQDQNQLTFLTFLTCGNMTARGFFFCDLLKKPCGFRWRELTFFFKGGIWNQYDKNVGLSEFRYLTRYFFPSWFHKIIHPWAAPLNWPPRPWTVEGWGNSVRVEANGPHPKRADTEIFFEETVGHIETYNLPLYKWSPWDDSVIQHRIWKEC